MTGICNYVRSLCGPKGQSWDTTASLANAMKASIKKAGEVTDLTAARKARADLLAPLGTAKDHLCYEENPGAAETELTDLVTKTEATVKALDAKYGLGGSVLANTAIFLSATAVFTTLLGRVGALGEQAAETAKTVTGFAFNNTLGRLPAVNVSGALSSAASALTPAAGFSSLPTANNLLRASAFGLGIAAVSFAVHKFREHFRQEKPKTA